MTYDCELVDRRVQPTVSVRTRTAVQDLPRIFGEIYGQVFAYLGELGEQPAGMPYAAYRNMDMQDLDLEIGVPVAHELAGRGDIEPGRLPGGKWSMVTHVGAYEQLSAAYEALTRWTAEQGLEASGIAYEFYFSGPEVPPEETRTEIGFPLKN